MYTSRADRCPSNSGAIDSFSAAKGGIRGRRRRAALDLVEAEGSEEQEREGEALGGGGASGDSRHHFAVPV